MQAQAAAGEPAVGLSLPEMVERGLLPEESLEEARRFWGPLRAWHAVCNAWTRLELLLGLLEVDGSYDNSLATLDAFWEANDQLLRGAAAGGLARRPARARAPLAARGRAVGRVRAEHLVPVFVGSTNPQTGKHTPPRSSLVGLMPMGCRGCSTGSRVPCATRR